MTNWHPKIRKALAIQGEAHKLVRAALLEVQKTCQHEQAWESPSGLYGPFEDWEPARRICCVCGIEEEAQSDFYKGARGYRWTGKDKYRFKEDGPYVCLHLVKSSPIRVGTRGELWSKRP